MASFLPIDYQKSIEKKRLVYKTTWILIFTYVLSAFNTLGIIVIVTILVFVEPSKTIATYLPYYIIFLIVFGFWAVINVMLLNAFVKIEGANPQSNRDDIIKALSKYFKLENLDETNLEIIRDFRLPSTYKTGRAITCLLDENTIYLNAVTLMRPAKMYILSGLRMYYKCRRVARQFQKLQTGLQS